MSEETKTRTVQEIGQDYGKAIQQFGDLMYRSLIFKEDAMSLVPAIKALNQEAFALSKDKGQVEAPEAQVVSEAV